MTRTSFITKTLVMALVLAAGTLGLAGCDEGNGTQDVRDGDVTEGDMVRDDVTVPELDVPDDVTVDDVTVDDVQEEEELNCPAACAQIPTGGEIGAPCVSSATCESGATCLTQTDESYGGRIYTDLYEGVCILYGPGDEGCDPEVSGTCPENSTCEYMGKNLGQDYYGCWDSCTPADSSKNLYDYNCGCRLGYECSITGNNCYAGCSNDDECCERWWDLNSDGNRAADEMATKDGCTNTCNDGDLFSGGSPTLCSATFACINEGDNTNAIGGPCEGDAWCPADGRCLDEFRYSEDPADPTFPGGYCVKDGCDYVGRGCTAQGGACADLGSADDPFKTCVQPCHFGRLITAADYECRKTTGEEYACVPSIPSYTGYTFWFSAPTDGSDGWCWPGNFNPTGTADLGDACTEDEDCIVQEEYGIGFCAQFTSIAMTPYCSANCNDATAATFSLCGGDVDPADPVNNMSTGACWSGMCWESCPDPTQPLATNGCSIPDNACYVVAGMFDVKVGTGLTVPVGICIPKCVNDAWCEQMWGIPMTCNPTTGACG